MPELPEVETVRRMLAAQVLGRTVAWTRRSRLPLREERPRLTGLAGRRFENAGRHGKYLLLGFEGGLTLLSHLGMSGRWLFAPDGRVERLPHVHAWLGFTDGSVLRYQDPRRFGQLRLVPTAAAGGDPSLSLLGPDPVLEPQPAAALAGTARGLRTSIKAFLLDQRRLAGIGNIYASEILFRAAVDPRRPAGGLRMPEWEAIAREITAVLAGAIERMGTTFSAYRTLWNEPGQYGEQLLVYDRGGEPCRRCGRPIRRIVQTGRSTYFCPACQRRPEAPGGVGRPTGGRPRRAGRHDS
jgi:formamidopyrimidine-DNA glycosylase